MNRPLLLFSLLLALAALYWNYAMPDKFQSSYAIGIVAYFYLSTAFVHRLLLNAGKSSPQNFVRTFMTFTALRLFLNLVVIAIYLLVDRAHAVPFVIAFLLFYFLFLIYEIIALQRDLKKK
jgi:F0F1-type ATP synthase assembly protein I